METNNSNNTRQKIPLGIGLIILVLVFITFFSLFNVFNFTNFHILGFLRGLLVAACSALIAFGFAKRLNWSRILFMWMTAFVSMDAFIDIIPIINDPKLTDKYSGSDKIAAANFFHEFQFSYVIFFIGMIIYVYRKKSYFINK